MIATLLHILLALLLVVGIVLVSYILLILAYFGYSAIRSFVKKLRAVDAPEPPVSSVDQATYEQALTAANRRWDALAKAKRDNDNVVAWRRKEAPETTQLRLARNTQPNGVRRVYSDDERFVQTVDRWRNDVG